MDVFRIHFSLVQMKHNNIFCTMAKKNPATKLLVFITLLLSAGCSISKSAQIQDVSVAQRLGITTNNPYRLIASDLVGALLQAKNYPIQTQPNILLPLSEKPLSRAIEDALVESGVSIARVPNRFGQNVLINTIGSTMNENTKNEYTVTVVLDRIGLKRRYIVTEEYVEPTSSLFVRGANQSSIQLNDSIFLEK